MIRISIFCLLFLQVLTLDPPPEKCRRPPLNVENPFKCCNIPTMFSDEDLKACHIEDENLDMNEEGTKPKHNCDKQICLLKTHNLMTTNDESTVDRAAIAAFLDKWVDTNADFKDAIEVVKTKCINRELMGPPKICEAKRMIICVGTHLFHNCPKWEDTDDCAKVKDFAKECEPY